MPTPTYTDTTLSNLIISKISQTKFNELREAGQLNENELYIVENETLDALSNVIKNVGTPVLSSDAANKAYVDGKTSPIATSSAAGIVKPDGSSLSVDSNGTLNVITSAFVHSTRTINGKALSSNIALTASDLSAVSINSDWMSAIVADEGILVGDTMGIYTAKYGPISIAHNFPEPTSSYVLSFPDKSGTLLVDSDLSNLDFDYLPLSGGVVSNYVSIIGQNDMVPFATISSVEGMGTLTLQDGAGVYYTKINNNAITTLNPFVTGSSPVVATMPTANGRLIVDTELNDFGTNFITKNNAQISNGLSVFDENGSPFFSTSLDSSSLPTLALDLAGVFYVKINTDAISANSPLHSSPVVATWPLSSGRLIVDTELSNYTPSIATSATVGLVKPDNNTITVDANGVLSVRGGGGGGSSGPHAYTFNTPTQTTSTTDASNDTVSVQLADGAINIVSLTSGISYLNVTFPQPTAGYARDFFVRLIITGSVPTISFSEYDNSSPSFDIADSAWADIEQGVNIIMFTETSQS